MCANQAGCAGSPSIGNAVRRGHALSALQSLEFSIRLFRGESMRRLPRIILVALLLAVTVAVPRTSWAQAASLTGPPPVAQAQDNAVPEYVRAGKLLDVRSG